MKRFLQWTINLPYFFVITSLIWWLAFFPGFYSGDSFGALEQAKNGPITNIYTAAWPLTLRILTFGGRAPALATLVCVLLLSYSVKYFCESALPKSAVKITTALLLIAPVVGAMGITLWHDIPMSAGLLLATAVTIKTRSFKEVPSKSDLIHLLLGAVLASYRPNGLPTLIAFFILLFLVNRSFRVLKIGAVTALLALAFSLGTTFLVGERSLVNAIYAQEWMRSDIACIWATEPSIISPDIQNKMAEIAPLRQWNNDAGCTFLNRLGFSVDQVGRSTKTVPTILFEIFKKSPLSIARIHVNRNAYLLPIPTYGAMHPPFIHSIIEFPDRGIAFAQPGIAEKLRIYVRAWNGLRPVTAFAGFWLFILILFSIFSKSSRRVTLPTLSMSLAVEAILFAVAPIPDGRYALFVLIATQSLTLGYFLDLLFRKRKKVQQ